MTRTADAAAEDAILVRRCIEGDPGAWREIFEEMHGAVRFAIECMLASHSPLCKQRGDDAEGDFWLHLLEHNYRQLRKFNAAKGTLKNYLHLVAREMYLRDMRRHCADSRPGKKQRTNEQGTLEGAAAPDESFTRRTLLDLTEILTENELAYIERLTSGGAPRSSTMNAAERQMRTRITSKVRAYLFRS